MKFAVFYEIPVPKPFTREKEHQGYKGRGASTVIPEFSR
jgi:hypothetical protein